MSKRRQGRERLVSGNAGAIGRAHRLLDQIEMKWRERIERIGDVLDT